MKTVVVLAIGAMIAIGVSACPRDPHPERTPQPSPSLDHPMQTGRQPAPEPTCSLVPLIPGKPTAFIQQCEDRP